MSNKQYFSHKGYTGSIEFSTEDMCLFGKVQMIRDLIMYDGETLADLKESFELAVDDYLEMCKEEGKSPDKPCSGTFNIRMSEELHRKSIHEANRLGVSLNAFVIKSIEYYLKESSLKNEFLFVNTISLSETLEEHLTEIKTYNLIRRDGHNYDYHLDQVSQPVVIESSEFSSFMNEGVENV